MHYRQAVLEVPVRLQWASSVERNEITDPTFWVKDYRSAVTSSGATKRSTPSVSETH